MGEGSGVPLLICHGCQGLGIERTGGREMGGPRPLLTLFRGHTDFPAHAPTALEVTHTLVVGLTVVGGVEHQTLASDHGTPARLHFNW